MPKLGSSTIIHCVSGQNIYQSLRHINHSPMKCSMSTCPFAVVLPGSLGLLCPGLPLAGALPGGGRGPVLRPPNIPLQSVSQHFLSLRPGLLLCPQTCRSSTHRISGEARYFKQCIILSYHYITSPHHFIVWSLSLSATATTSYYEACHVKETCPPC